MDARGLILTCTGLSFAHGTNDGQKEHRSHHATIIGLFPAVFALNQRRSPNAVAPGATREAAPLNSWVKIAQPGRAFATIFMNPSMQSSSKASIQQVFIDVCCPVVRYGSNTDNEVPYGTSSTVLVRTLPSFRNPANLDSPSNRAPH